jgi:hypothetical protein
MNDKVKSTQVVVIGGPGRISGGISSRRSWIAGDTIDPNQTLAGLFVQRLDPIKGPAPCRWCHNRIETCLSMGIKFGKLVIDLDRLCGWKEDVVQK